jgi:hypothetical protein
VAPKFLVNATPPTFLNRLLCLLAEGFSVHYCTSIFNFEWEETSSEEFSELLGIV